MNEETRDWFNDHVREKGIKLIQGKTPNVLERANEMINANKRVAGIFHTTC